MIMIHKRINEEKTRVRVFLQCVCIFCVVRISACVCVSAGEIFKIHMLLLTHIHLHCADVETIDTHTYHMLMQMRWQIPAISFHLSLRKFKSSFGDVSLVCIFYAMYKVRSRSNFVLYLFFVFSSSISILLFWCAFFMPPVFFSTPSMCVRLFRMEILCFCQTCCLFLHSALFNHTINIQFNQPSTSVMHAYIRIRIQTHKRFIDTLSYSRTVPPHPLCLLMFKYRQSSMKYSRAPLRNGKKQNDNWTELVDLNYIDIRDANTSYRLAHALYLSSYLFRGKVLRDIKLNGKRWFVAAWHTHLSLQVDVLILIEWNSCIELRSAHTYYDELFQCAQPSICILWPHRR